MVVATSCNKFEDKARRIYFSEEVLNDIFHSYRVLTW